MPDKLIEAIEELEPGSCAPAVVAAIYSMPDMEQCEGRNWADNVS